MRKLPYCLVIGVLCSLQADSAPIEVLVVTGGNEQQLWWTALELKLNHLDTERYEGFTTVLRMIEGSLPNDTRLVAPALPTLASKPVVKVTDEENTKASALLERSMMSIADALHFKGIPFELSRPASSLWRKSRLVFVPEQRTIQLGQQSTDPWSRVKRLTQIAFENRRSLLGETALQTFNPAGLGEAGEEEICRVWKDYLLREIPIEQIRFSATLGCLILTVRANITEVMEICDDNLSVPRN